MSDWQNAFEVNNHAVGRAVHEAWMTEKIRQGFADHVWIEDLGSDGAGNWGGALLGCGYRIGTLACQAPRSKHHADMLDYDDLAPHIQEYDIHTGIVGFRMGYEAAQERIAALEAALSLADEMAQLTKWGITVTDCREGCEHPACLILRSISKYQKDRAALAGSQGGGEGASRV